MKLKAFTLERFFAKYKSTAPYLLCCSDCEALTMQELLAMADEDSLQLWNDLKFSYTSSTGHPLLRQEIAKLYDSVTPEEVLVLNPEEGIFIAMTTILKPGDHVVTAYPGYQSLYEIANSLGCKVEYWLPQEQNGWYFDIAELKALIRKDTKMLVLNFPHNPTGATLSKTDWLAIITLAKANDVILFSDEMYRFLEYDADHKLPAACDLYENAISLFGMSKSFALPGLRMGWLITKNKELLEQFTTFKDYTSTCSSAPSEILALMGLRAKADILTRNLNIIRSNLTILEPFFERYAELFEWRRPTAGPIGFPKLKGHQSSSDFCADLVKKKGVLLLPANIYDFDSNHFRIGFARKNMPEALEKLEEFLRE